MNNSLFLHPRYVRALLADDGGDDLDLIDLFLTQQVDAWKRAVTRQYAMAQQLKDALELPSDSPEHIAARRLLEALRTGQQATQPPKKANQGDGNHSKST